MAGFDIPKGIERKYIRALRKIARVVAGILGLHIDGAELHDVPGMNESLKAYSEALGPWASREANIMIKGVSIANEKAFKSQSKRIGTSLRTMFNESAIGTVAQKIHTDQVQLIKSLPLEAGKRAQKLAQEAALDGTRAADVAEALMRTEHVTLSRATLIARTEIAKANAAITQARAEYIGATHYVWETAEDSDVRPAHQELQGKIFEFNNPPYIEGEGYHGPGSIWNCRCFSRVLLPE